MQFHSSPQLFRGRREHHVFHDQMVWCTGSAAIIRYISQLAHTASASKLASSHLVSLKNL